MKKAVWTRCDELNRPYFLDESDSCFYHHEYYKGRYDCSDGNQKLVNLKIDISCKGTYRWKHKICAIKEFSSLLIRTRFPPNSVFLAAPTSKRRDSKKFDSRLDDVIMLFSKNRPEILSFPSFDVIQNTTPVHTDNRESRNPSLLKKNMIFYPFPDDMNPSWVFIIDDIITTGGHFVAMRELIKDVYPHTNVRGLFFAKRIYTSPPNSDY